MESVTIGDTNIDIHEGPIAVMASGGADSSILLYILSKYVNGDIYVISSADKLVGYQEPIDTLKVCNYIIKQTGKKNIFFRSFWVDDLKMENLFDIKLFDGINVSMVYSGFTRPPEPGIIADYQAIPNQSFGSEWDGTVKECYYNDPRFPYSVYAPFANTNKIGISNMYTALGVRELYNITRSCCSLKITEGHCGECWWCKERIWAFGGCTW